MNHATAPRHPAGIGLRSRGGTDTGGDSLTLDHWPAPPALAPYIGSFFQICGADPLQEDMLPAGPAMLAIFLRGEGLLRLPGGLADASAPASVITPLRAAARIEIAGPWHVFGALLSPLGWAALTGGLSASEHGNRLRDAGELLGGGVRRLAADLSQGHGVRPFTLAELVARSVPVLQARLHALSDAHVRLVDEVQAWLARAMSPVVDDLYRDACYSPRQLQRLVDRYFGLPPKQLARQHRALRAAALLADPATTPQQAASVADHFYDQSHLIREVRLVTGRTPARLVEQRLPLLDAMLGLHAPAVRRIGALAGAAPPTTPPPATPA
ncbi:UNVERIFIED_ORG: AraC-like DNA-binding protein [Sphingomonas sp. R1F5B]